MLPEIPCCLLNGIELCTLLMYNVCSQSGSEGLLCENKHAVMTPPPRKLIALSCLFFLDTDLFSFSRRARVHWSCSLSWCSRWASSMCCPQGESWSRAGLEWRRRYWSSSLSPPHRRQHTEPPAHSHQQHKAEPRTTWDRPKQGKASKAGKGIPARNTMKQDWTEWNRRLRQRDCARFHRTNIWFSVIHLV